MNFWTYESLVLNLADEQKNSYHQQMDRYETSVVMHFILKIRPKMTIWIFKREWLNYFELY